MAHDFNDSLRNVRRIAVAPFVALIAASCGSAPAASTGDSDSALSGPSEGVRGAPDAPTERPNRPAPRRDAGGGDAGAASSGGRWPNSGDFAEWYGRTIPALPYVVAGQIEIDWSDLDTTKGYEWGALDKALSAATLPTTLQVNGNRKPSYVFSKVPYVDLAPCTGWPKDQEVSDVDPATGCLRVPMYWHSAFQDIYTKFIAALGAHLQSASGGKNVVALRQNWNAIGTEHLSVPSAFQAASTWTVPAGVSPGADWSESVQYAYEGAILDAHVSAFFVGGKASPPVFVRTSLESGVLAETSPSGSTYAALFGAGQLAWFTTGAEMGPRAGGGKAYDVFLTYTATGKTLGLAEPWANAWGIHTSIDDHHWASPPQFLYWRLLSDMELGISYVDCYGDDLEVAQSGTYGGQPVPDYQPEFDAAFRFASKYAGYAGRPGSAPGAFIAFRPADPAVKDYSVADYAEFVALLNPAATNGVDPRSDGTKGVTIAPPYGVKGDTYYSVGPTTQRFGAWARTIAKGSSVELGLDDAFRKHENAQREKIVNVTYLDDVAGHGFDVEAAGKTLSVTLAGTGQWQTATLEAKKSLSANSSGADVAVTATKGTITLHMVEVTY